MKHVLPAVFCAVLIIAASARAEDAIDQEQQNEPKRVDWRFSAGATYMSGFQDVADYYLSAYGVDAIVIPVGAAFNTTIQISHGNVIASMPSVGVGPIGFIYTQETIYGYNFSSSSSTTYVDIPITATYGIKFFPRKSVGPYVRGGVAYHITIGDAAASSSPGGFVGFGVEFLQTRRAAIAVEAAYDSSKVSFKGVSSSLGSAPAKDIKTGAMLFSVRVVF